MTIFQRILALILLVTPFMALAGFNRDLYFGLKNDAEVKALQEFLSKQRLYLGPVNGNFFTLTKDAVKKFQQREKIEPALGYFGVKTRARANASYSSATQLLSGEELRAFLTTRIQVLQGQLRVLQEKLAREEAEKAQTNTAVGNTEEITPVAEVIAPAPVMPTWVSVSGQATSTFPEIENVSFKWGEFKVYNGLAKEVLFSNFELEVVDEIESTPNRNKKISFLLRDGLTFTDPLISKTDFTFILAHPQIGNPYVSPIKIPFPITLKSKEEKTVSIWVEQLKYVKSGTLQIRSTKTVMVTDVVPQGRWNLVLTRESPL